MDMPTFTQWKSKFLHKIWVLGMEHTHLGVHIVRLLTCIRCESVGMVWAHLLWWWLRSKYFTLRVEAWSWKILVGITGALKLCYIASCECLGFTSWAFSYSSWSNKEYTLMVYFIIINLLTIFLHLFKLSYKNIQNLSDWFKSSINN